MPATANDYLWLLAAALMAAYVAAWHGRAAALERAGRVSGAERRRFTVGALVTLVGFCLALQAIVSVTGESRPACLAAFPPTTPASVASSVVTLAAWGALLWWVWRGRGAEWLGRFGPALVRGGPPRAAYAPAQVRRAVTALVLAAGAGGAIAGLLVPPPPDCRSTMAAGGRGTSRPADSASHGDDSAFARMQERGRIGMGVDQNTSTHSFEPLPDGGRVVLRRDPGDSAGVEAIRAHMRRIAAAFGRGDFAVPGFVHAGPIPGADVMAARRRLIVYAADTVPGGAQLSITTTDPAALRAVHDFLAFQRREHRVAHRHGGSER